MSLALNSPKGARNLFIKDLRSKAEKGKVYYYKNSTSTGKIIFK